MAPSDRCLSCMDTRISSFSLHVLLLLLTLPSIMADHHLGNHKLMVVLMDGFRWDYVDKYDLPNFKRLWTKGAKADYMQNDYPTLSYPNYYTLMTGLHTESHGMTGNFMYDTDTDTYFLIGTNRDQSMPHWWENGEPLWVTASMQGKASYMFYWPGCEVTIRGYDPTYCRPYSNVPSLQEVSDAVADGFLLLTNGTADLVGLYSEQPDYVGHKFGPDHDNTKVALETLDMELGKALDRLDEMEDDQKFNLILFSDHGMTNIDRSRVINITDVLQSEPGLYITIMESAAIVSVYVPSQEAEDKDCRCYCWCYYWCYYRCYYPCYCLYYC